MQIKIYTAYSEILTDVLIKSCSGNTEKWTMNQHTNTDDSDLQIKGHRLITMYMLNELHIVSRDWMHCSKLWNYNVDWVQRYIYIIQNWIPVVPVSGFLQSTPPNCKSGATVIYVQWARSQSIEAWIPWTPKFSSTPNHCCLRPSTAHEMKAIWEPWAPSVRLVVNTAVFTVNYYASPNFVPKIGQTLE